MGLSSLYFPLPYIVETILSLYSILFGNSLPLFGVFPLARYAFNFVYWPRQGKMMRNFWIFIDI